MRQGRAVHICATLVGAALVASPAAAQVTATASAGLSVSARATAAIQLPSVAIELRSAGVPAPEVHTALVAVHTQHIPAPEVHVMFTRSVVFVHEFGPPPSFGAFIEVRLGEGFRGPRLYDAIHVEVRERGRRHPGLHKGHAVDTPGHRRHGRSAHEGPPGQVRMGGMGRVRVEGPSGRIDVRGGGMGRIRVEGPSAMVRVHAPSVMVRVGAPSASVRVRGGGGGASVRVRGGGGGMGGMGGMGMR